MPKAADGTTRFVAAQSGASALPAGVWAPDHWASVVLADFVAELEPHAGASRPKFAGFLDGSSYHYTEFAQVTTGKNSWAAALTDELEALRLLVGYRPAVMAEAMAQKDYILQYFCGILSFNPRSHPATVCLCVAALRVASFTVMYWKNQFNRARPSRLSPDLMPPIDPPGHASYPSGHATQAFLIARCLEAVMPAAIIPGGANPTEADKKDGPLRMMASRIARNREVLGLHYPSDSLIGEVLAEKIYDVFKIMNKITQLTNVAKDEWRRE